MTQGQPPRSMDGPEWGQLVFLSVLWGGAFFFVGAAVREVPPLTIVFARVFLAALLLLPLFLRYGHHLPRGWAAWRPFFVMGLLNNVLPFSLLFFGQTQVTVGLASIINAMTPLFTVLVMAGFGGERLTALRVAGVVLGILGVAVLRGGGPADAGQTLGIGLCLAATVSYSFAGLWGRRHLGGVPPLKSATCQLICSSLVMALVAGLWDRPWELPLPSAATLGAIIGLAAFGTALAYIVFFRLLVSAGASNVMLVTLLIPVTAMALGILFLGEAVHPRELSGAAVIGLGLVFIDGRLPRRLGLAGRPGL
ncbi:MAG: DMT family transporter [Alphaproteobacteria bacterium]